MDSKTDFEHFDLYPAGFVVIDPKNRPLNPRLVRMTPKSAVKALLNSSMYKGLPSMSWEQYQAQGWRIVACYFQFKTIEHVEHDFNNQVAQAFEKDQKMAHIRKE